MNDIFFLKNRNSDKDGNVAVADFVVEKICLYLSEISISVRLNNIEINKYDYVACRNARFLVAFIDKSLLDSVECVNIYDEFLKFHSEDYVIQIILDDLSILSSSHIISNRETSTHKIINLFEHIPPSSIITPESKATIDVEIAGLIPFVKDQLLDDRLKKMFMLFTMNLK